MEHQNSLGLYISKHKAAAVVLSAHGPKPSIITSFSIDIPQDDKNPQEFGPAIASEIANTLRQRQIKFTGVSIALDCSLFTQHELRSSFTDYKHVASTIRFDAEEAVATDATELAVTFNIISTDAMGSRVTIFTAQRHLLSSLLTSLQANGIDPTAMEPDVVCVARFLDKNVKHPAEDNCLFTVLGDNACYIVHPSDHNDPATRTFLVGPKQDKTATLAREIPITIASMNTAEPITSLLIADSSQSVDPDDLAERTALDVASIDLLTTSGANPSMLDDNTSATDFTIAYGAALAEIKHTKTSDFRQDFSPYQGRKVIIQNSLRIIGVAMIIVLCAIGVYFQTQAYRKNQDVELMTKKLTNEYKAVMFGKEPPSRQPVLTKLESTFRGLEKQKSGQISGDDRTLSTILNCVLESFNAPSLKNIKIEIDSVSITTKSIKIIGSTAARSHTLKLFKAIDSHTRLTRGPFTYKSSKSRDIFTVSVELK